MNALAGFGGWPGVLGILTGGGDLTAAQAEAAMGEILEGAASPAQTAALIVALRLKGETIDEMVGLLGAMDAAAERVPLETLDGVIDIVGTGGDRSHSINVSTMTAFVVAAAGAKVCKHGGRAASSSSGSADVLEALGVNIDPGPAGVAACVARTGMGFCFAARYHAALRHAAPVRRELGVATVMNFLGPLANPAGVRRLLVGVSDHRMADKMAGVLRARGVERALVVWGHDGLDEITTTTTSSVVDLNGDEVVRYELDPAAYGISRATMADLAGGSPADNAEVVHRVFAGEAGPHRDIVVLNAAVALMAAGRAEDIAEGLGQAAAAIDDGRAKGVVDALAETSNRTWS